MNVRGLRKEMNGKVISDKMSKTIVVEVDRHVAHPKYHKVILRKNKFYAHDEKEIAGMGDTVVIRESKPLSKLKRWKLVSVVRKGPDLTPPPVVPKAKKVKAEKAAAAGEA